jgi:hypothetical protein
MSRNLAGGTNAGCGCSGLAITRFSHAAIPAYAALAANASSHDLNRRLKRFRFDENTLDFDIGEQWKYLSDSTAAQNPQAAHHSQFG